MEMKVYILEDGMNIMHYVLKSLEALSHFRIVGHAAGIAKASSEISTLRPEILIIDTDLAEGNGFELFKDMDVTDFQVIFLAIDDRYAVEAINMGASGYLIKPVAEVALTSLLARCYRTWERNFYSNNQFDFFQNQFTASGLEGNRRLALKTSEYIEIVELQDIIYCKSDKGYTTFHLKGKAEILVSQGLKHFEDMLIHLGFIRCHQSYLINLRGVKKYYRDGFFLMKNDEKIPVSSRKKEDVLKYLQRII